MLTVTNDLSSFSLAAGEPFVLEVQLLDSAGRGIDINDEAMFLTFYSSANRAIVRDYAGQPAQYEGTRYSDDTGEFFRWAFDGRFSEGMYKQNGVRVELAQRLLLGRKILSTGALSVIPSAATVPSLDGELISDFAIRVTIKAAMLLGGAPSFTLQALPFLGAITPPTPAPAFTSAPSIDGTIRVGQPLSDLTYIDGIVTNGVITTRVILLDGAAKAASYVLVDADVNKTVAYRNVATGLGPAATATSGSVPVQAAVVTPVPGSLQRLSVADTPHFGASVNSTLAGATDGSTLKIISDLSAFDQYGGVTINSAARTIAGTVNKRSYLIRETLGSVSRDTLIFAPESAPRTMKLGMNVAGLNYYTPNNMFIDHMKCADMSRPPLTMDANGMPLSLKPGDFGGFEAAYKVPMPDGRITPVKFRVITDGDMDMSVIGFTEGGYDGPGYGNRALIKEGADWVFTHDAAGAGKVTVYLKITALRSAPTYMALVRDDEAALYRAGKICRPGFAADMAGFTHIRWLNQSDANMTDPCPTPVGYITYASQDGTPRCVPLQRQVDICIELGIGGWFHEHIKVSDAEAIARQPQYDRMIAAGLIVKKELSNEIWNGQFAQNAYGAQRAAALGYVEGSPPDYNSYEGGPWFNGYRTAQLAALDRGKGYRWCIGCQPANPSQQSRVFQGFAVAGGVLTDLKIWTCANYMTGSINTSDGISTAQFNAQLQMVADNNVDAAIDNVVNFATGSVSANLSVYQAAKATANAKGLALEMYEGTSGHLNSAGQGGVIGYTGYDAFLFRLPDSIPYGGAVTQNLEVTQQAGCTCATVFDYDSIPANSIFGRFGIKGTAGFAPLRAWLAAGGAADAEETPAPTPTPTPTGKRYMQIVVNGNADNPNTPPQKEVILAGIRGQLDDGSYVLPQLVSNLAGTATYPALYDGNNSTDANAGNAGTVTLLVDWGVSRKVRAIELTNSLAVAGQAPGDFEILYGSPNEMPVSVYRTVSPYNNPPNPNNGYYNPPTFNGSYPARSILLTLIYPT